MAEYIKREDAITESINAVFAHEIGYSTPIEEVIEKYINDIPAADVRENVHGKWITYNSNVSDMCCCSVCERYFIGSGEEYDFHYCPNCGVDMRPNEAIKTGVLNEQIQC